MFFCFFLNQGKEYGEEEAREVTKRNQHTYLSSSGVALESFSIAFMRTVFSRYCLKACKAARYPKMPPVTKTKTTNCNDAKRPSWISKTAMVRTDTLKV